MSRGGGPLTIAHGHFNSTISEQFTPIDLVQFLFEDTLVVFESHAVSRHQRFATRIARLYRLVRYSSPAQNGPMLIQ